MSKILMDSLYYRRTFRIDELDNEVERLATVLDMINPSSKKAKRIIERIVQLTTEGDHLKMVTKYEGMKSYREEKTESTKNVILLEDLTSQDPTPTPQSPGVESPPKKRGLKNVGKVFFLVVFFMTFFPFILPGHWLPWCALHNNIETHPSRTTRLNSYPRVKSQEGDLPAGFSIVIDD